MWTFDNPPLTQLRESRVHANGVARPPAAVERSPGGRRIGSFVSRGTLLTNHHVALGQLQKASTPQKYVADGFCEERRRGAQSADLEVTS